ncbi:MAG: Glycosyl transferase family 2 [Syntrophorhabdus sp. PtaU1.Bin058]|nr:MAG: Glycosyl transferase family 2 [Syntrophorhabdus sp. PtaU1.Bin058]
MSLKGKKIACFVALPHHTRFLWPVTEYAERLGARIVYFTTMSDFPYEMDLVQKGKECKLLQNYVTGEAREKIQATINNFFEVWKDRYFTWDGLRHWPIVMQANLLTAGFEDYFCLEEFIKAEKPDMIYALHERNRWGKLMGHLSAKYGIPYVTSQEGDYYEDRLSFSSHSEYSTALVLWGDDTKERLAKAKAAPEKMVLVGNTHLSTIRDVYFQPQKVAKTKKDLNIPPGRKVVLFLVSIQWGIINDPSVWEQLLGGISDDITPIFKWHPKVSYEAYKHNIEAVFKEKFPSCLVFQNYDPYHLLPVADYCVTLGKTTLAVEALSFGRPLFSFPGTDRLPDYYAELGISQSLAESYEPLYRTIREGVPEEIRKNVDSFLHHFFYMNNQRSVPGTVEIMDHIMGVRHAGNGGKRNAPAIKSGEEACAFRKDRVSYVVAADHDQEALLATLTSLSQNVGFADWEVIVVTCDSTVREALSGISGDIQVVESEKQGLAHLYNKGANASTGEYLIFMKSGILYFKDRGIAEAMQKGIVGIPLKGPGMEPHCLGIRFDFNHVPRMIRDIVDEGTYDAVGGGLIAMRREHYETMAGFDERITDQFIEADICLEAREKGYDVAYLPECLAIVFKETFGHAQMTADPSAISSEDGNEEWRQRIAFFAKWCGKLPKDDDYIKFAGELLKV